MLNIDLGCETRWCQLCTGKAGTFNWVQEESAKGRETPRTRRQATSQILAFRWIGFFARTCHTDVFLCFVILRWDNAIHSATAKDRLGLVLSWTDFPSLPVLCDKAAGRPHGACVSNCQRPKKTLKCQWHTKRKLFPGHSFVADCLHEMRRPR